MACLDQSDVLAFVGGGLAPARVDAIVAHIVECVSCREHVVASSEAGARAPSTSDESDTVGIDGPTPRVRGGSATTSAAVVRGTSVGRYTILDSVGRGGFGEVFAAYDPELDRKIAVKFLRGDRAGSWAHAEARLLREAKAIAKISHQNIVTVYDAGTFSDRVFVAMEFVEGATLKDWLAERARTRAEILGVFKSAARGLAAAHAAGLVHRDFKPGNVMVRKDGRVLVMDFGLVRQLSDEGDDADGPDLAAAVMSSEHELELTRTGELLGTPAYMAPEQLEAGRTDARTDQFSFCVALYAALYGERPFEGESLVALRPNVLAGRVRPASARANVPSWIRRVLLRGLAVDPAARFPTMPALVVALDDAPASRRKWIAVAAVGALGLGLALVASRSSARDHAACADGAAHFAGVWEGGGVASPNKDAVRQAFARTGKSYAEHTFTRTAALLDAYVDRWVGMYRDTCEATRLRAEHADETLALRTACLDDRVRDVRALTDVFRHADAGVVANAISAAAALPALEACVDVASLAAEKRFGDPEMLHRLDGLRDRFAHVQALANSGQCAAAEREGKPLLDDVRATQYRPLLAEVLSLMGSLGDNCVDPSAAIAWLKEGYFDAIAAHLDRVAVEAAIRIPVFASDRLGDVKMANDWLEISRATLARVGPDERLRGMLFVGEGLAAEAQGNFGAQVEGVRQALTLFRRTLGSEHILTLENYANLGVALANAGRLDEALATDREAYEATARALGPEHPSLANIAVNECEAFNTLGRHAEARAQCLRALEIWTTAGADPGIMSYGRTGLGNALLGLGLAAEAVAPLEQAVHDRLAAGIAPRLLAESRFALARALWSRVGERARARVLVAQARENAADDAKMVARIDAWLAKPN